MLFIIWSAPFKANLIASIHFCISILINDADSHLNTFDWNNNHLFDNLYSILLYKISYKNVLIKQKSSPTKKKRKKAKII